MRTMGSPISRVDRARIRYYLSLNATAATIREELHMSDSTIKRVKRNVYGDNIEDDHAYLFKQEGGDEGLSVVEMEKEVIEISSDSESDGEEEDGDGVDGDRKSRRLRCVSALNMIPLADPESLLRQPRARHDPSGTIHAAPPHSEGNVHTQGTGLSALPSAKPTSGKRVRFNDDPEETERKRQKKAANIQGRKCSDCNGARTVFGTLHDCSAKKPRPQKPSSSAGSSSNPPSGAAGPSRTKAPARGASVNSLNLGRLSLDPPGVPALGMVPKLLPPALIKPVSASSAKPKPAAVPAGPSHAKPSDIPPNAATRRPAEGALDHYLTKMGLLHCAPILYRAGFRTVTDLDMLKVNLAKEKTREEVRSMLMPREGGGMVLRDWLKLSEALVPKYGEY